MSDDKPFAGTKIHVGLDIDGDLAMAWKGEPNILSVYIPRAYLDKSFRFDLADWPEQREGYKGSDSDFRQYDDIVNAAWHNIGQRGIWLNKRTFKISNCNPGEFFSRVWRGRYRPDRLDSGDFIPASKIYGNIYAQSLVAAASLFNYLLAIFKNVEPSSENYAAFGHRSRELLILACTEVESAWRAVSSRLLKKDVRAG